MRPDLLHPFFLKSLVEHICEPLSILFEKSMSSGKLPNEWLNAIITAVHKKGDRSLCGNCRPISLTCVISKIMGCIIRDAIVMHMKTNNLFANEQHGFVPNENCVTQLIESLEAWGKMIDKGEPVDVIFTDFAKAFDSVPHKRLLVKLCIFFLE